MKVLILGHKGRLGHIGKRYLEEIGHKIVTLDDKETYDPFFPENFLNKINSLILYNEVDAIINCIFNRKGRNLIYTNAILPIQLSIRFPEIIKIHPSTDGIFSGNIYNNINRKWYKIDDIPDAMDIYGISKILGESVYKYPNTWIIRCSTIGPEKDNNKKNKGLLNWFLSQKGKTINGFVNHKWNGLTTLEWMKCASELIYMIKEAQTMEAKSKIVQPGTEEIYSKANILKIINNIWKLDINIIETESGSNINRCLEPIWKRESLEKQLQELYDWYYTR